MQVAGEQHINSQFKDYTPFVVIIKYWLYSICCRIQHIAYFIPKSLFLLNSCQPPLTFSLILVVVHLLSCVWPFAILWTTEWHAHLSSTLSRSLLKLMALKSVIPSNHLILCCPLLFLPSIFPSIRIFSNEWPKYWSFRFSISFSDKYAGLTSFRIDRFDLLAFKGTLKSSPTRQFKSISSSVLSILWRNSHIRTWLLEKT